jgi:hypothetical protein
MLHYSGVTLSRFGYPSLGSKQGVGFGTDGWRGRCWGARATRAVSVSAVSRRANLQLLVRGGTQLAYYSPHHTTTPHDVMCRLLYCRDGGDSARTQHNTTPTGGGVKGTASARVWTLAGLVFLHRFGALAVFSCCCKIFGSTLTLSLVFDNQCSIMS